MNMHMRTKISKIWPMLALLLLGWDASAQPARCFSNTSNGLPYYTAVISGMKVKPFNPGDIPLNGLIDSFTGNATFTNKKENFATVVCSSDVAPWLGGIGQPNGRIYATSVPNVGVRMWMETTPLPYTFVPFINSRWNDSRLTIQLIKTGNITAAGKLQGSFLQYRINNLSGQVLVDFSFGEPIDVIPRVPTCTVGNPDQEVPMGSITPRTELGGVGSVSSRHVEFSIELDCAGGDTGTATRAFVTLSDANRPGNTSTTLFLRNEAGSDSGLGIQILKDDTVLNFGPDSSAPGNANQWLAATIPQGQSTLSIPLKARYVQTATTIKGGKVFAKATFTMSYQ